LRKRALDNIAVEQTAGSHALAAAAHRGVRRSNALCEQTAHAINSSWRREVSQVLSETRYEHIRLDENQVPTIAGTTMKVVELVLDHLAYGWSPEELHFQHPYLRMGQIYSALAYYWDHKADLDQDLERRLQFIDQVQQTTKPIPLAERLKAQRLS
jgi:uncharacterized protein (DUF433 family)